MLARVSSSVPSVGRATPLSGDTLRSLIGEPQLRRDAYFLARVSVLPGLSLADIRKPVCNEAGHRFHSGAWGVWHPLRRCRRLLQVKGVKEVFRQRQHPVGLGVPLEGGPERLGGARGP